MPGRTAAIPVEIVRLGELFKELRTGRELSLRAVGEACQLTPSYLAKLEAGRTFKTIGLVAFVKLATFYEIPVAILLRDAGFIEEASDELPEFETYLRQKYQLSPAAIADLCLVKEIVDKKYAAK